MFTNREQIPNTVSCPLKRGRTCVCAAKERQQKHRNQMMSFLLPSGLFTEHCMYISVTIFCHLSWKTSNWFSLRSRSVVAESLTFSLNTFCLIWLGFPNSEHGNSTPISGKPSLTHQTRSGPHTASPHLTTHHAGATCSQCHSRRPPFLPFAWLFLASSLSPASKLPEDRH